MNKKTEEPESNETKSPQDRTVSEKRKKIFEKLQKEFISKKIGLYLLLGLILLTIGIIVVLNHIGSKKQGNKQKTIASQPETKQHLKKQKKNMNRMLNIPPINAPLVASGQSPKIKNAITKIKNNLGPAGETGQSQPKMSLREKLKLKALASPIISVGTSGRGSALSEVTSQIEALKKMKPFNPATALSKIPQMQAKEIIAQEQLNLEKTNPNQGFLSHAKTKTLFTKAEKPAKPASPYEVEEGTIIPAVLMTKINSNLPGMIKAQVVQDIYSYNGRYLEIPKGSFIIGVYSSQLAGNQSRLLVAFNVLELPNGDQVNLTGSEGTNSVGEAGFHDLVNTHFWQMFGTSLLLSIINVGAQMYGYNSGSTGSSAYGTSSPKTSSGVLLQGGSQALQKTGHSILQKYTNIPPTIIIRQGYRFNVFVAKNIAIKPYK